MSMNKGNVVLTITRQDSNFPLIVKTNNNGTSKRYVNKCCMENLLHNKMP